MEDQQKSNHFLHLLFQHLLLHLLHKTKKKIPSLIIKLKKLEEERTFNSSSSKNRNDIMSEPFSPKFSVKIEPPFLTSSTSVNNNTNNTAEPRKSAANFQQQQNNVVVSVVSEDVPSNIWRDTSYNFKNDDLIRAKRDKSKELTSKPVKIGEEKSDDDDDFDFLRGADLENQILSTSDSPNEYGTITPRSSNNNNNNNNNNMMLFKETESATRRPSDATGGRPSDATGVSSAAVKMSGGEDQVARCSSNAAAFQQSKKSGITRMKTRSRLMDPPEEDKRSGRMNNTRSGFSGKTEEIEEDDPFGEDLPEEYKKGKFRFLSVFEWVSMVSIVAGLVCSFAMKKLRGKTIWGMKLWKWEVMGLLLICGGLISGWLIRLVVFFIERNFVLKKRVLYFVYALRSSVQKFLWLGWVLLAWILILDKKVEKETSNKVLPYVTKILVCFMVATFVWFVKTLLLKVLTMNFHVSAYFDRIQDALFNQYVMEALSGPPYLEIQRNQEEEERLVSEGQKLQHAEVYMRENCYPNEGKEGGIARSAASGFQRSPPFGKSLRKSVIGKSPMAPSNLNKEEEAKDDGIRIDHLHRWNQENVSAWNMKRLINIVRKGVSSTIDEQLDPNTKEDDSALHIRSEKEAKGAAKNLFSNVAAPGSKHIHLPDLMRFLKDDEAHRTINLFGGVTDEKGISKSALKDWVVNLFRERRALALSLNDTKTAVCKLHNLVNVVVGLAVAIIWFLILGVPVAHFLVFISSQVVVLGFVFGNTCKTTFEAVIFLFVMHPFDVGDRCEIDGVQMIVEEMNILTTAFLKFDNHKIVYPNSVLATKPISNYYRSPDMGDAVDFAFHISTPVEKISLMKERITRYVDNNSKHWYPAPMIVMRDVEDMNRLKYSLWLSHRINFQDMGERFVRRSLLMEEMIKIFKDLDIEYRMLPTDVNVRNMPPITSDRLPSNWTTTCVR